MFDAQIERAQRTITASMFGGNILSTADRIGEGTFDNKVEQLNVKALRYPGGSLTEDFFDIRNPDASTSVSQSGRTTELMPISTFLDYAQKEEIPVILVVPTRNGLTEGAYGTRSVDVNEVRALEQFVTDILRGKYGFADIRAFEIGNEYWGSGMMSSVEYGKLASAYAKAIQTIIDNHKNLLTPGTEFQEPMIAVQIGQRGQREALSGNELNRMVMAQFDASAAEAVDAVVAHYYTDSHPTEFLKGDNRFSRMKAWEANPAFGDLSLFVTEWNAASPNSSQLGARQPATLISMFTEMVMEGVDYAFAWPIQHNTKNDLAGKEGDFGLTLGGEAYKMMSDSLIGSDLVGRQVNAENGTYIFQKGNDLILYVASHQDEIQDFQFDVSSFASATSNIHFTEIKPDLSGASLDSRTLKAEGYLSFEDSLIKLKLEPHAFIRLVVSNANTPEVAGKTVYGTAKKDHILGTDGADMIYGLGGDDKISSNGGDDTVFGGGGADRVNLGPGNDTFGKDVFAFELDGDTVFGQTGNDLIIGGGGADLLDAGLGDDTLIGAAGNDTLLGGHGNDMLHGGAGSDFIDGSLGADFLFGGIGDDHFVFGFGDGDDIIADLEAGDVIDLRSLRMNESELTNALTKHSYMNEIGREIQFHDYGISLTFKDISFDADIQHHFWI